MTPVQAAITCVGFPRQLSDLRDDVEEMGPERALDMDILFDPDPYDPDDPLTWSAPRHLWKATFSSFITLRVPCSTSSVRGEMLTIATTTCFL